MIKIRQKLNKSTKTNAKEDDDNSWVFESLVGFLTGPIWNIPVVNFIENKSSVFDPNEDNESEYKIIHEEYKHLVDLLLNSFMEDIGITAEQFGNACNDATGSLATKQFRETLFEQVWAADNQQVFVRMMTQKNIELQLQALEYLKNMGFPVDPNQDPGLAQNREDDDGQLREALRKSLEEHEETMLLLNQEREDLERALAATLEVETLRLQTSEIEECKRPNEVPKSPLKSLPTEKSLPPLSNTTKQKYGFPDETQAELQREIPVIKLESKVPETKLEPTVPEITLEEPQLHKEEVSAEEIAKRRAYLLEQRDRLVARKQQERKIQLESSEEASGNRRPKSARVAKDVLENAMSPEESTDPDMLAARRALADRLRAEVVGKK